MLILRLLMLLIILLLVLSGGMYVFTRDGRYLKFARQLVRFLIFSLMVFAVLFVLERYVLVGWKVLV